jgi:organic radical activating enzyme
VSATAIPVAETFRSIQGEGATAGVEAVFLRTSRCNLTCPGWGDPAHPHGCDTTEVWRQVWRWLEPDELVAHWDRQGYVDRLAAGAHLVVTGGEPLLWQARLVALGAALAERAPTPYVEVETNATLLPDPDFDELVAQYNCSPKLRSAGNDPERAHRPEALSWFAGDPRAWFKFVVQAPGDADEVERDYVDRYGIDRSRVLLMPQSASRDEYLRNAPAVAELCLARGFRYSPRLHLVLWDQATGV